MKRMEQAALLLEGAARMKAPVNTGQLRASITHDVREVGGDIQGLVGSNVVHAPYMEFGTGTVTDGTGGTGKAHFPPAAALARWCHLHGLDGLEFVIARAIGRRGGLAPRRYLREAFEEKMSEVRAVLMKTLDDVAAKLGAG